MKKLLSIMLVLLMALSVLACNGTTPAQPDEPAESEKPVEQPTEAPAEPTDPSAPAVEYEGLALNIKNKTGKTIDYLYIWPADEDAELMGASVVPMNWQDKDADGENYEKNIYIVRKAGVPMQIYLEFDDHTYLHFTGEQVGTLAMYDKLSFKGPTAEDLEHEANDDPADIEAMNLVAAIGKTADNFYPGYELIPVELKNKTGKNIVEYYFYEEGAAPETYANVIGVAADLEGNIVNPWVNGRPYLFTYFVRPHTDANYYVYVVFEDGTNLTYPIENWFKPDGDGNLPNEISLKSAEDKYETKVQFDGDVEKDVDVAVPELLVMTIEKRLSADGWYPTYATVEADAAAVEAAKAALAAVPMIETEEQPAEPAEPAEPIVGDDPSTWAPVFVPAEGYVQLALQLKNKTGKDIKELYIYPVGEEIGNNVTVEPLPDKKTDDEGYERFILLFREEAKLGAMEIKVVYGDGEEAVWKLTDELKSYDKLSMDGGTQPDAEGAEWKHKASKEEDYPEFEAVIAAGIATDDFYPEAAANYTIPEGYVGLALQLKNKTGKDMAELYIYAQGEEIGQNLLSGNPLPDKKTNEDAYERFVYIIREGAKLGAMEIKVVYGDGEEAVWKLTDELKSYDKLSMDGGTQPDAEGAEWKHKASKEEDYPEFEAVLATAIPDDGWYPKA